LADLELHVTHTRITNEPDAPHLTTTFSGSLENIVRSTLNYPDFLVVDLDPYFYSGNEASGAEPELHPEGFAKAREVAYWFRELVEGIGLHPFIKTTGKTGLHLYVPIARTLDYDSVRAVAETLAKQVLRAHPKDVTIDWAGPPRKTSLRECCSHCGLAHKLSRSSGPVAGFRFLLRPESCPGLAPPAS
jgi:bifunctional non-homologous end joining protein LigD